MTKKILIVAGEASGDLHGSSLIREMKKIDNNYEFLGIGGDRMIAAGLNAKYHIKDMAFLGFFEILKHLPFIRRVKNDLLKLVEVEGITSVILIDYPGFNLNIAGKLKERGVKIIYYISPQIWAWGKNRINKIKKLVDKMIVVFPFEESIYLKAGVDAEYAGHPLIAGINNYSFVPKEQFMIEQKLDNAKKILLVMPGSRLQEIKRIFPESIKAASRLAKEYNLQIVVACAQNLDENLFESFKAQFDFKVVKGFTYELLKYSHLGIIKSGTSTLEAGLFSLPCVVVYSTSWISYKIGKALIKVTNIAMANLILGETVMPELIQHDANENKIFEECKKLLDDDGIYDTMKKKLSGIREILKGENGSAKAAQIILSTINEI
ncbi:MAG: lipid-A-disaccharide synthase [bacterium]